MNAIKDRSHCMSKIRASLHKLDLLICQEKTSPSIFSLQINYLMSGLSHRNWPSPVGLTNTIFVIAGQYELTKEQTKSIIKRYNGTVRLETIYLLLERTQSGKS